MSLQKNHAITALIFGGIEIIVALVVVICSFVLADKANIETVLTPYWAGIPFFIPGILGVVSGFTKNSGAMIAFMVLNIICFIINVIGMILVFIVVALWVSFANDSLNNCTKNGNTCTCRSSDGVEKEITGIGGDDCKVVETISALLVTIAVFLAIGALVTIASSILGCIATCCSSRRDQPPTIVMQPPQSGGINNQGWVGQQPQSQDYYSKQ